MSDMADKSDKKLKRLTIRDFPEDLHQWLKVEAAKKGVTIGEFINEICTYWQQNHPPKD